MSTEFIRIILVVETAEISHDECRDWSQKFMFIQVENKQQVDDNYLHSMAACEFKSAVSQNSRGWRIMCRITDRRVQVLSLIAECTHYVDRLHTCSIEDRLYNYYDENILLLSIKFTRSWIWYHMNFIVVSFIHSLMLISEVKGRSQCQCDDHPWPVIKWWNNIESWWASDGTWLLLYHHQETEWLVLIIPILYFIN